MSVHSVKIRNVTIGEGVPKICVPLVGKTEQELIAEAAECLRAGADLAEWRIDCFGEETKEVGRKRAMTALRQALGDLPLLITYRTKEEGGAGRINGAEYVDLNREMLSWGSADLLDVELSAGEAAVLSLMEAARQKGVRVICSSHDFQGTPPREEIVARLRRMQELGADILKMAVMPRDPEDVLTLLAATNEMRCRYADRPLITMAMDGPGLVSRLCGEAFGSSVTFGTAGQASAPGQIDARRLREALELIHAGLTGPGC